MQYIKSALGEFKNIRWLKLRTVAPLSLVVIVISISVGFLIGFLDNTAQYLIETFIS